MEIKVNCRYADLPIGIKAFCVEAPDGVYTIMMNSRYDHDTLLQSYRHELNHILNRDFEKFSVNEIECQAHKDGD